MLLKERYKGRDDEVEDASSYWNALRKGENTENWNKER